MNMNMSQVVTIARREYLARVRSRTFIIMTAMVPVLMVVSMVVVPFVFSTTGPVQLRVAVLDAGTGLAEALTDRLSELDRPQVEVTETVEVPDDSDVTRAPFSDAVRQEAIDGYLVLVEDEAIVARARYYARETGNIVMVRALERAVESTILDRLLADTGVDVAKVRALQRSDLDTVTISNEGEEAGGFEVALVSTLALAMLLFMTVIINGEAMALAIVEEKTSRLIEVILGAVTATEFMTGKILGVLGAGFTQLAVWVGVALVGLLFVLPTLSVGAAATGVDLTSVLSFELLVYFSIFFALGYCFYSILFVTVGATCTSTEELSQVMPLSMLPLMVSLVSTFYVMFNPSTSVARVLSLIPPFTPLVMLARVNVLRPPLWEVWLGIVLLVLGIVMVGWLAARIFRYVLLMHGKRPTLPELLNVMRAG